MTPLRVRPFDPADTDALTAILNDIIAAGGTTAYETPFTAAALRQKLHDSPTLLCCHTVLQGDTPLGYQVLHANPRLPDGVGDIASFTRRDPPVRGAGRLLFNATLARAQALGLDWLNATIRADNVPGLSYYHKMGFVEYDRSPAVPLADGTPVDRIHHRRSVNV